MMKLKDIRLHLPEFKKFSLFERYGISNKCYIAGYNIIKPYKFYAVCGWNTAYFEYSESGYEEAIKWIEEKRLYCLKQLGVLGAEVE